MAKIVIVPGEFTVRNDGTICDGRGFNMPIVPTPRDPQTFMHTSYQQSFYYNPLFDHLDWHGMNNWHYGSVDTEQLRYKYTNLQELNEYLELYCHETILVQRYGSSSWHMYFRDNNDRLVLERFLKEHEPIRINLPSCADEITFDQWNALVEEVKQWSVDTLNDKYDLYFSFRSMNGTFKSDADAALFKLKWTTA